MSIYPTITINGVSSNTIAGLLITSLPPISKPLQRTLVDVIDGRAGDVVTPLGFAAYDKPVGIALTTGYDIDEVIAFFNSSGIVTFSNEPDKYYKFAIYDQIDFERLIRFKTATVIFHVQPYKYANNEDPLNFAITSGEPVSVTNNGNTDSKPDLIITGEGVVNLDINGEQVLNIDFGEDEQAYIIDSEAMNAYAAENAIKDVKTEFSATQASGTPTPSAPIPIVGVDKVNVVLSGKNQLAKPFVYYSSASTNLSDYFFVKAGTYRFSFGTSTADNWRFVIRMKDASGNNLSSNDYKPNNGLNWNNTTEGWLHATNVTSTTMQLTFATDCFIRILFGYGNTSTSSTFTNAQLEVGSTATTYEPYNGTTALINLGGTYYGGSVDAVTGKITLNYGYIEYDGSEDEVWSEQNGTYRIAAPSDWYFEDSQHSNVITCNMFIPDYRSQTNNAIRRGQTNVVITSNAFTGLANFKQFISSTPIQVVYELATPIVVYASNTAEIQAVLGVNNIFSDAGDVEVTYKAGGAIHTETGEIVTFTLTPEDYERGAFVNRQIVGNYDNIKLKSGANTISLTGNATSLTVDKYSRWI